MQERFSRHFTSKYNNLMFSFIRASKAHEAKRHLFIEDGMANPIKHETPAALAELPLTVLGVRSSMGSKLTPKPRRACLMTSAKLALPAPIQLTFAITEHSQWGRPRVTLAGHGQLPRPEKS